MTQAIPAPVVRNGMTVSEINAPLWGVYKYQKTRKEKYGYGKCEIQSRYSRTV